MDKIYLSINNNEEVILLPITPEEYEIDGQWENQEIAGLNQPMNVIQHSRLVTTSFESFFPVRNYPFSLNRNMLGMEYVEAIQRWRERRVPIRVIITRDGKPHFNMAMTIDGFSWRTDKSGDIKYKLDLKEFRFVEVIS